ncbi:MAG: NINE protein [Spirochaetaceae bacterium]|nr:NINE protein [Spirochaetaceae bacterium]
MSRYNTTVAYILWLISGCGLLGFHRFYLGKVGTGVLWIVTGGLGGIGCVYDAVTMPRQVREANIKAEVRAAIDARDFGYGPYGAAGPAAGPYGAAGPTGPREGSERAILRLAKRNGGPVTAGELALESELSIDQAKKALEKLVASGIAEMRVRSSGVVVYFFPEFAAPGPGEAFEV